MLQVSLAGKCESRDKTGGTNDTVQLALFGQMVECDACDSSCNGLQNPSILTLTDTDDKE